MSAMYCSKKLSLHLWFMIRSRVTAGKGLFPQKNDIPVEETMPKGPVPHCRNVNP